MVGEIYLKYLHSWFLGEFSVFRVLTPPKVYKLAGQAVFQMEFLTIKNIEAMDEEGDRLLKMAVKVAEIRTNFMEQYMDTLAK